MVFSYRYLSTSTFLFLDVVSEQKSHPTMPTTCLLDVLYCCYLSDLTTEAPYHHQNMSHINVFTVKMATRQGLGKIWGYDVFFCDADLLDLRWKCLMNHDRSACTRQQQEIDMAKDHQLVQALIPLSTTMVPTFLLYLPVTAR